MNMKTLLFVCTVALMFIYNSADAQVDDTSPYILTEISRFGDVSRGDTILFESHQNSNIAVNSKNQIFVGGGWSVSPVVSFSGDGRFIGFVGAEGVGPGEFTSSTSVVVGPSDSVYVFDSSLGRLLVFDPSSFRFVRSLSMGSPEGSPSIPGNLVGITDRSYIFEYLTPFRPPGNSLGGYDPDEPRYSIINSVNVRNPSVKNYLAKVPAAEKFVITSRGYISVMQLPFGRDPFFAHQDGLLYTGWNNSIDISVISDEGGVIRTVEFEHEAVPITKREIESQISNLSRRNRRELLRYDGLPKTRPAYDAMVVDDMGQIWIRRYPDSQNTDITDWMIFSSDGSLIGKIELPTNLLIKAIQAERVYASINSEESGPYIVVYSISERSDR